MRLLPKKKTLHQGSVVNVAGRLYYVRETPEQIEADMRYGSATSTWPRLSMVLHRAGHGGEVRVFFGHIASVRDFSWRA